MSFTPPPDAAAAAPAVPNRRTDAQPDFDTKSDAFLNWMVAFLTWLGAFRTWAATFIGELSSALAGVESSKNAAQNAAIAAETSAQTAAALSGAPMWVAGNYTFGDYVWSPTSLLGYRRKTAGTTASATDPASDPAGWKLVGSAMSMPQQELAGVGPHQLMVGMHYLVLHPLAVLVMPVGAAAQEQVRVTDMSDGVTVALQREPGGLFNGQAVDTVLDSRGIDRIFTKTVSKGWL